MSLDELISRALEGEEDDERAWEAIRELHLRGDAPTLDAASRLLTSSDVKARGRAADILAHLGSPNPSVELRTRCADALLQGLEHEQAPAVLHSIGVALGHLRDARAVEALLPFARHEDANVRFGVVMGLIPHDTIVAIDALIELSTDSDDDVRNWATFGLGSNENIDTPELRDALFARVTDANSEIRGEALVGLAQRQDRRVLEPLRHEFAVETVRVYAIEAAELTGDASFLPILKSFRGGTSSYFANCLEEAISALEG